METEFPTEFYWADTPRDEEEEFVGYLQAKRDIFYNTLSNNAYATRIMRNYRYYHNLYFNEHESASDMEIKQHGPEAEYLGLSVNHLRSIIKQMHTLVTQYRPAWDAKAKNTEPGSIQQARISDNVLEHYMHAEHVEDVLKLATEHALIFNVGYVWTEWDFSAGPQEELDPQTGDLRPLGDVRYSTPYVYDVIYDTSARTWREVKWVYIRRRECKWDVLAQHMDREEEIREQFGLDEEMRDRRVSRYSWSADVREDMTDVWYFYHAKSPAMPEGRQSIVMGDLLLDDGPMLYDELPLDRITAGEYLLNCFGYSPANDLTGVQEAFNSEVSTILTNHKSFGVGNVWAGSSSSPVTSKKLEGGLNIIYSDEKPEALNLVATPQEILNFPDKLGTWMEQISGINSVARGQPEANLRSGTALAMIDSKALQAASFLQAQYHQLLENVGTKTIRYLNRFAGGQERVISVAGKFEMQYIDSFKPEKLGVVDKVSVRSGSALTRSLSGRVQIAQFLLESGMLKTPEEFFTVLETGQLDSMIQADVNELSLIREENERLLAMERIVASAADNHLLHIREHHSLLGSVTARRDTNLSAGVMGHLKEHMDLLRDISVQELQMVLGYNVPPIRTMQAGPIPGAQRPGEPPTEAGNRSKTPKMEGSGMPGAMPQEVPGAPKVPVGQPVGP